MSDSEPLPRCGDHVVFRPTGEMWLTAFAEGEVLVPAGLPIRMARIDDCDVVFRISDHDHERLVMVWEYARDDIRRPIIQRLYGKDRKTGKPVLALPESQKPAVAQRRRRPVTAAAT